MVLFLMDHHATKRLWSWGDGRAKPSWTNLIPQVMIALDSLTDLLEIETTGQTGRSKHGKNSEGIEETIKTNMWKGRGYSLNDCCFVFWGWPRQDGRRRDALCHHSFGTWIVPPHHRLVIDRCPHWLFLPLIWCCLVVEITPCTPTARYHCISPTHPFPEWWHDTSCIHTKWHTRGKIREMGHSSS
jgi:hypothetical protein